MLLGTKPWLFSWYSRLWLIQWSNIITFFLPLLWAAEQKRHSWFPGRGLVSTVPRWSVLWLKLVHKEREDNLSSLKGSSTNIKIFQKRLSLKLTAEAAIGATPCYVSSGVRQAPVAGVFWESISWKHICPGIKGCCWCPGHNANAAENTAGERETGRLCGKKWCLGTSRNRQDPQQPGQSQDVSDRAGKSHRWQGAREQNAFSSS